MRTKTISKSLPIIAITMGDPNGIGPEIIIKLHRNKKIWDLCLPVVIGDAEVIEKYCEFLRIKSNISSVKTLNRKEIKPGKITVLDQKCFDMKNLYPGRVQADCGKASAIYIREAVKLALNGKIDAITTAPISKEALNKAGFHYPGHTEFLGKLTKTRDYVMMFVGGDVKVALVTTHMSLKDVPKAINKEKVYRTIKITTNGLKSFGIKNPKIAVCALNPHGGEGGIFGSEEKEKILPAVLKAKKNGCNVSGPHSADTIFYQALKGRFDAVISMYHDQGLIPVKIKGFGRSVNITLGLPIRRTSVDHGTAFDIAGRGIADTASLFEALKFASFWAKKKIKNLS